MTRRPASDTIRISRRTVRIGIAVTAVLLALVAIVGIAMAARANEPVTVATAAQMKVQQAAAERDVERAYEQSAEQVTKVRASTSRSRPRRRTRSRRRRSQICGRSATAPSSRSARP